jgi:hypothetical protein
MAKLTVIYNLNIRESVLGHIVNLSKKLDIFNKNINTNQFRIVDSWPSQDFLNSLPLDLQVEEIDLNNDSIVSVRKLIVDVETEIVPNQQIPATV